MTGPVPQGGQQQPAGQAWNNSQPVPGPRQPSGPNRGEPGTWKYLCSWEGSLLDAVKSLDWLPRSDLDSALLIQQELTAQRGGLAYAHGSRQWYVWDGTGYRRDEAGRAERLGTDYGIRCEIAIKAIRQAVTERVTLDLGIEAPRSEHAEAFEAAWKPFEPAARHVSWLGQSSGQAALLKMLSVVCSTPDSMLDGRTPIALTSAAEVRKRQPPPFLVEGLIPATGTGVFFGESGVYKSFLVLNLLLCVGAGQAAFLGHAVNGSGFGIYVMGEGQYDAGLRLDAAVGANPAFTDMRLRYIEQAFPLSDEAAVGDVIARCRELASGCAEGHQHGEYCRPAVPVRLVVFDSFADFYGADDGESSNTDMQRLIASMKRISAELGCVVMANAHTGHGGQDEDGEDKPPPARMRGASRFRQAWDFELMATGGALVPTKNRYGELAAPVRYAVEKRGGSLVIVQPGSGAQAAEPAEPDWPYPVTETQVDRVTAAVKQTPGMSMTAVARAAGVRKTDTGIALLKAAEIGLVANAGTKSSPKYVPGPLVERAGRFRKYTSPAGTDWASIFPEYSRSGSR